MRTHTRRVRTPRAGIALIEVAVAMGLLSAFGFGTFLMTKGVIETYRTETAAARQDTEGRQVMETLAARLRRADIMKFAPLLQAPPFSDSTFDYMGVTIDDLGNVTATGAERLGLELEVGEPNNGFDDDGDGLVDERNLVWTRADGARVILCTDVAENLDGETPGNGIDDNGNGLNDEAGFCATLDGEELTLRLTLLRAQPVGPLRRLTFERRIQLRNSGVLP